MRKAMIQAKYDFEKSKKTEADLQKELDKSIKESQRISIGIHKGEYLAGRVSQHNEPILSCLQGL